MTWYKKQNKNTCIISPAASKDDAAQSCEWSTVNDDRKGRGHRHRHHACYSSSLLKVITTRRDGGSRCCVVTVLPHFSDAQNVNVMAGFIVNNEFFLIAHWSSISQLKKQAQLGGPYLVVKCVIACMLALFTRVCFTCVCRCLWAPPRHPWCVGLAVCGHPHDILDAWA